MRGQLQTLQDSITELNPVMSQGRIDFRFALDEIPHWVSTKKGKLPAYDVLVLFTKYLANRRLKKQIFLTF